MRGVLSVVLLGFLTGPVLAQSMDSINLATNLGSVLGSESFCGLTYNQDAIGIFIEDNVAADDMEFAVLLNLMSEGAKFQNQDMSASSKTAHCVQTRRVAKSYGFVD